MTSDAPLTSAREAIEAADEAINALWRHEDGTTKVRSYAKGCSAAQRELSALLSRCAPEPAADVRELVERIAGWLGYVEEQKNALWESKRAEAIQYNGIAGLLRDLRTHLLAPAAPEEKQP